MATEAIVRGAAVQGPSVGLSREAAWWFQARVADAHQESTFALETDERFWRARRVHGGTSSMFEARLPATWSAGDLAAAIVRWAAGAGLVARSSTEDGHVRVTLVRPAD